MQQGFKLLLCRQSAQPWQGVTVTESLRRPSKCPYAHRHDPMVTREDVFDAVVPPLCPYAAAPPPAPIVGGRCRCCCTWSTRPHGQDKPLRAMLYAYMVNDIKIVHEKARSPKV